jgi:hypothetical protein
VRSSLLTDGLSEDGIGRMRLAGEFAKALVDDTFRRAGISRHSDKQLKPEGRRFKGRLRLLPKSFWTERVFLDLSLSAPFEALHRALIERNMEAVTRPVGQLEDLGPSGNLDLYPRLPNSRW